MKNFIKFPFIKFKKAKLHSWAQNKYIEDEKRRQEEVEEAYRICGKYIEHGEVEKAQELIDFYNFDPLNEAIFEVIKRFTLKEPDYEGIKTYSDILALAKIFVEITEHELFFKSDYLNFSVKRFSEIRPEILKVLKDIDTVERGGRCHTYSVLSLLNYCKEPSVEVFMVTGRIYQLSPNANYLHSWLEIVDGDTVKVIDCAKNAVMDRDYFYEVNHVSRVERVHSSTIVADYKLIRRLADYDPVVSKVYYENVIRGRKLYRYLVDVGEIKESEF